MKTMLRYGFALLLFVQSVHAQLSWKNGATPEQNQSGTLVFNATGTPLAGAAGTLYLHTGVTLNGVVWQNVKGSWGNNTTQPALTSVGTNLYELNISPTVMGYYGVTTGSITKLNVVVRNAAGTVQSADLSVNVGAFDMNLTSPLESSTTLVSGTLNIQASNTGGTATYTLFSPSGTTIHTSTGSTFSHALNGAVNGNYRLQAVLGGITIERKFNVVAALSPITENLPAGMKDGVNYDTNDATKATLVLNAPGKEFVYVAGNFNNWQPTATHSMKKDPTSGKFWLEVTGLTAGTWYAFQYWVCDDTPVANSPKIVKTADPFSTLVLSPFDDPEIISLGVYPGLPVYTTIAPNQEREVSVIQTGSLAYWQYNWTSTSKMNSTINRKDLIIYEVLVRDFGTNRSYQDLIDKIDYFKNLKVNAIQLMPIMEFEGNLSWGYNPTFHLAPDKRYGSPAKLKQFIDLCHQNGIAVILDVALNHVFGRSPLERMWMLDTDNNGWSNGIASDNPYLNITPKHTLNVGADLNHFREPNNLTNTYVTRTLEEWINNYKIDGFRWDLTQGFTNACSATDDACSTANQPDRITKLKWYADAQWSIDPNFYVIFEHWAFGEISEFNNYRLNESPKKGIMTWQRADHDFAELLKGNGANLNTSVNATHYRAQGNIESHDEERIMFKATSEAGQTNGNLNKALARMPAAGAMFFLVPGPKMIWHFSELGWNLTQNTCSNGTVGDCRLDTKPQPQWTQNWMGVPERKKIYDTWARLIGIRTHKQVFKSGQFTFNLDTQGRPRLDVWTSTAPSAALTYVMAHANFSNAPVTFQGFFPYTGTWYNLMDNSPIAVTTTTQNITLAADGGFVVYGNQPVDLATPIDIEELPNASLKLSIQNPATESATVFYQAKGAEKIQFKVYSIDGRLVQTQEVTATEGTLNLSLKQLASGVYFVEMLTDKGRVVTKLAVY